MMAEDSHNSSMITPVKSRLMRAFRGNTMAKKRLPAIKVMNNTLAVTAHAEIIGIGYLLLSCTSKLKLKFFFSCEEVPCSGCAVVMTNFD